MEIVLKVLAFLLIFVRIFECVWAIYIVFQAFEYFRGMKTLSRLMFQTFILGAVLSFWGKIIIDKIIWWRGLSLLSLLGLDFLGLFVLLPMVSKPKRWFWFSLIMYPLQIILSIVVLSLFVLKV